MLGSLGIASARRATILVGLMLAVSAGPLVAKVKDLDTLSDADFDRYLTSELNDIFTRDPHRYQRDQVVSVAQAKEAILLALSDAGDDEDGDDDDDEIDFEDLEAEMEEAGTSINDIVNEALEASERLATLDAPAMVKVALGDVTIAQRAGFVRLRVAVDQTKRRLLSAAESAR